MTTIKIPDISSLKSPSIQLNSNCRNVKCHLTHSVFCSLLWLCWLLEKPGFSQFLFPKHTDNGQSCTTWKKKHTIQMMLLTDVDLLYCYSHDL